MKEGGFRLRKRNSNSKVLKDKIKEDTLSCTAQTNTSIDCEGDEKIYSQERKTREPVTILGCGWNVVTDKFHFRVRELIEYAKSLPPTKRSVLKASAKIFDPIEVLSQFTVNFKILFQLLCCDHVDWDDQLDDKSFAHCNSLLQGLESLNLIEVPRCYFSRFDVEIESQQIHGLSDASEKAYAAVVPSDRVCRLSRWVQYYRVQDLNRTDTKTVYVPLLQNIRCRRSFIAASYGPKRVSRDSEEIRLSP